IRDKLVTGVQTCALPILHRTSRTSTIGCTSRGGLFECPAMIAYVKIEFILILVLVGELRSYKMTVGPSDSDLFANNRSTVIVERSEERRVGKECRSRRSP